MIADRDLLLRVRAAGVDPGVRHLMTGLPYLIRVMGFALSQPKHRVRGFDVAGGVEAVGSKVTRFRPGDEVFGVCGGSFAEYARMRGNAAAPKPANLGFEQAAVVPVSGLAALQALRDVARVRTGEHVLILGAGGGVGTFAVQIAKAYGARVTGVCSAAKTDLVRSLGADHAIDYTREDFAGGGKHDVILDTAGNRPLSELRRALSPRGTLVIIGGEGGGKWLGGVDRQFRALLLSPFIRQRLRSLFSSERFGDLQVLKDLIEAGKVTPVLDRTYPLREAPEAIRGLAQGHARGKVALSV